MQPNVQEKNETKLMMTMKKFMIIKTSSEEVMDCEHDNETVTKMSKSSGANDALALRFMTS